MPDSESEGWVCLERAAAGDRAAAERFECMEGGAECHDAVAFGELV